MPLWRERNLDDTLPGRRVLPVVRRSPVPTYRVEAYDIWSQGVPIHTGIPEYRMAIASTGGYSGALPLYMFYIFYSGIYGRGKNSPRPLAAFLAGKQLPLPIRVTPSNDIEHIAPAEIPLDHRRSLRVMQWGNRSILYASAEYGSWGLGQ